MHDDRMTGDRRRLLGQRRQRAPAGQFPSRVEEGEEDRGEGVAS